MQTNTKNHFKNTAITALVLAILVINLFSMPGTGYALASSPGTVIAWGWDGFGLNTVPAGLSDVTAISAGGTLNLALKSDGSVVAWGDNTYGQSTVPAGLSDVVAISAGGYHSLALKSDGSVVAWGWNYYGQSTVPAGLSDVVAVAAGAFHSLALKSDGSVIAWGWDHYGQSTVPAGLSDVVAISAGRQHSLALKSDGSVVAWGDNTFGQTDVPAGLSDVVAISAGDYHNLALKSDGTVVAWGYDAYGQTSGANGLTDVVAISAGGVHSLALRSDGSVFAWGFNNDGQSSVPVGLSGVMAISAGGGHNLVIGPLSCPAGTYDNGSGCVAADPGYYVPDPGSTSETPCLAGTYQDQTGAASCKLADPGYYVDTVGAVAQTMCPDGYTSDAGASSCYPINTPPSVDAGGSYSGDEGSAIAMSGASASDSDGDALTYAWSVSSSLCSFDTPSTLNPNLTCSDNGNYTVTLSVDDGVNPAVTSNASVTVNNVAPTLGAISVDAELVPVNTAINASADFTDPGTNDTHTATWNWGDSTSSVGTVTESAGSGSVSDSHSYSATGVYTIGLTVTDKDGGVSNEAIYQYVVVYDPSAGFVTGGGWIDSPAGAYVADPSLSGKTTFGFVSKYKNGTSVPTGNTSFVFNAAGFSFYSDSYEWLVVNQSGANAQFKGSGTVNDGLDPNGNPYKFMLWAGDGSPDTFRIQIWWEDNAGEHVVYDNGFDQAIGGGSIVVHSN